METWIAHYLGRWSGNNRLYLSWPVPAMFESDGSMEIFAAAQGKGLRLEYQWSHEGQTQQGTLLLAWNAESQEATAAWLDSWHQDKKIMSCVGTINTAGVITVLGHFSAPPDADWGWRITLTPAATSGASAASVQMRMDVIKPDGTEKLAMLADYYRRTAV